MIAMMTGWINAAIAALPGTEDALFQKLWNDKRLLFDGRQDVGDTVDECSARFVAATLRRGGRLLLTLPDFQPHRPAFLLATALIRHLLDCRTTASMAWIINGPVLYFGSAVGIRDQLRRTSVLNLGLNLAQVFGQQDIRRGGVATSTHGELSGLPRVMTVYAPADPIAIVKAYNPAWIAVDCGDASSLDWLQPLLEEVTRRRIPVIAWGQNPLSECLRDFASGAQLFTWPPVRQSHGNVPRRLNGNASDLLCSNDTSHMLPLVLEGESVCSFSALLRDAGKFLGRASQHIAGPFERDAIFVHWRYLRALEALAVPLDFYDAEAPRFWGLKSVSQLRAASEHFRIACSHGSPRIYGELESAGVLLDHARANLETEGCPLWEILSYMWMEDRKDDEVRIYVFPSDGRKRLFQLSMLARHNVIEDDLHKSGTYVASLNELRRWMHTRQRSSGDASSEDSFMPSGDQVWHPVLIGLPSPAVTPLLFSVLLHPKVDIVLYPHQCPSFMRRQGEWSACLNGSSNRNFDALAEMSGVHAPSVYCEIPVPIAVDNPVELNVKTVSRSKTPASGAIWQPEDAVSEVARLLQVDDEAAVEEVVLDEAAESGATSSVETSPDIWCEEAVNVQFDQGWHAHFAPDDIINVVQGGILDPRYVGALKVGQLVLLIHGQHRQSLYDLILSRVHRHPSIELHLAIIRRWQEELGVAFHKWQSCVPSLVELQAHGQRDLGGLLRRMRARGSQLVSTLTLSFWLRGFVLCPLDPEDLHRVAEVLDMSFVRQFRGRIVQAASRLRGLHRGLSIKLNHWLENHASGADHANDDDVIDNDLGLTFGDVRNSLLMLRVISIQKVTGPILRSNLGRAEKDVER